jgi:regulator of cell morphogenesis and NO signaling
MKINRETNVKDIVTSNPGAVRVLEQAGVDYCCGGGKSLHDACTQADVSSDEILVRLAHTADQLTPADADWLSAPLSALTQRICQKHHRYVREAISRIRELAKKVIAKHGANHPELASIESDFLALSREMVSHMQKEEQILFPYIEAVEKATNSHTPIEPPFFMTVRNPIQVMMREHDSAGELMKQIRKSSSQYAAPQDACTSFQLLYQELRAFEADLHEHVHLENNILFPRAVEMESKVA